MIDNAFKFTNEGSICIGHKIHKNNLIFYIEDTGIGIDESKRKVIFEPFRQAEENHDKTYYGTGLGLAICKRIVDFMGGKIWLNSEVNKGSVFYFSIQYYKNNPDNKLSTNLIKPSIYDTDYVQAKETIELC